MVRHVIYGAVVGRFIMKLVERFTMSFGEFVSASIEPCALMLHYGNTDRCCGVVRNDIVARRICSYMNRNYPNLAPNFYIDERFLELDEICTNIPELYVVSGTLNSEPSILNRPLGNQ